MCHSAKEEFGDFGPYARRDFYLLILDEDIENIGQAYNSWATMQTILLNFDVYDNIALKKNGITREKVESIRENAEKFIKEKEDKLKPQKNRQINK